jgi:type IV secretory pathway TrbF-like protein
MSAPLTPQLGSLDGHTLDPMASEEWQRIEQAYKEIQRRDERAEYRTWRMERFALALLAVIVALVAVLVWAFLNYRKVQAFVQVVQVDDKGKMIQLGVPQDLLSYTPQDGLWMDMLGEWVRRVRWREEDNVHAKEQWKWVYRHTCGQARRLLQTLEEKEQPFKLVKKLQTVEIKSITKTPVPESYQVLWTERSTERASPMVKVEQWAGTFSVGRIQLPNLTDVLDNRLGLCVTAFDLSPQPGAN